MSIPMAAKDRDALQQVARRYGIADEALVECLRIQAEGSGGFGGTLTEASSDALDGLRRRPLGEVLVARGHLDEARREGFEAELPAALHATVAPAAAGFPTRQAESASDLPAAPGAGFVPGARFGNVKINRKLGAGGMGEVWLGFHEGFGLPVAVKVLPERYLGKADVAERFLREAQVAARLDHPNIFRLFDVGRQGDRIYMVMEYVEGQDLEKYEEDHGGRLPVVEVARMIGQVAHGLAYAHSQGVIHRDIKPANAIRRSSDARVKILDFGLARSRGLDQLTAGPAMMGTLPYMAYEQLMGAATAASDVYSLGVAFYRMLTGKPPVTGDLPDILGYHTKGGKPAPLGALRPVPEPVERLVMRMLAHKAAERPTAAQAAAEIDGILDGMGELRSNATPSDPPRPPDTLVPRLDVPAVAAAVTPAAPATGTARADAVVHSGKAPRSGRGRVLAALGAVALLAGVMTWGAWKPGADSDADSGKALPVATQGVLRAEAGILIAEKGVRGAAADMEGEPFPGSTNERPPKGDVEAGKGIRFVLRSAEPVHVYVFNIDGAGQGTCLYPDHYEAQQRLKVGKGEAVGDPLVNPLDPVGGAIMVPPTVQVPSGSRTLMRFIFDKTLGAEWFLVVAARRPVAELEALRPQIKAGGPTDPAHQAAVAQLKQLAGRWEAASLSGAAASAGRLEYHKLSGETPLGDGWYVREGADLVVWTLDLEHR